MHLRRHGHPDRPGRRRLGAWLLAASLMVTAGCGDDHREEQDLAGDLGPVAVSSLEALGQRLYFDPDLSQPAGQSCASCHLPTAGFADPDAELPTSRGVLPDRFGNRNTPTAAYALFSPEFHFDAQEGLFVGGQFLDGRAATLEEQAKAPFLNPVEMNNADRAAVVDKVRQADYAALFEEVFGAGALDDAESAYEEIAEAIAAFERSEVFRPFTSKYDYFLAGRVALSDQELRGLELFEAEDKGNCAACHPSRPGEDGSPPLFTDFTYDNLGVPPNPDNPFLHLPAELNSEGDAFVDLGLGGALGDPAEDGKFKVGSLRNIAITAPYMHNGVFATLEEVVDFYNTRDVKGDWPDPEVAANVNHDELGDLRLSDREVEDIVAFLRTLTDGFALPDTGE